MSESPPVPPLTPDFFPLIIGGKKKNEPIFSMVFKRTQNDRSNIGISYKNIVTRELDISMHKDENIEEREVEEHMEFTLEGMKVDECMGEDMNVHNLCCLLGRRREYRDHGGEG